MIVEVSRWLIDDCRKFLLKILKFLLPKLVVLIESSLTFKVYLHVTKTASPSLYSCQEVQLTKDHRKPKYRLQENFINSNIQNLIFHNYFVFYVYVCLVTNLTLSILRNHQFILTKVILSCLQWWNISRKLIWLLSTSHCFKCLLTCWAKL